MQQIWTKIFGITKKFNVFNAYALNTLNLLEKLKVSLHLHEYDDKALSKKLEKEVEEAVRSAKERGFNPYTEVREFVALWSEWLLATKGQDEKLQFLKEAQSM